MDHFAPLIQEIEKHAKKKLPVFVAISGFGGAGKSSLTEKLREYFKIDDQQVIHIDHLYSNNPDGPGIFDQNDWDNLETILKNARNENRLTYIGKNYKRETLCYDEPLPNILLIEGIRLFQPRFMPYFDISVWINCPYNLAVQRAKARDRLQGEAEDVVNRWDTDWGPKDRMHYNQHKPDKLASFIYEGYAACHSN